MVFKWSVRRVQFAFDPVLIRVSLIRGLSYSRFVQFDVLLCKSPKSYRAPHRYSAWRCHKEYFSYFRILVSLLYFTLFCYYNLIPKLVQATLRFSLYFTNSTSNITLFSFYFYNTVTYIFSGVFKTH